MLDTYPRNIAAKRSRMRTFVAVIRAFVVVL